MTNVDFACRSIMLRLVYTWAQHGGRYVQLPPAHYWHNHWNERNYIISSNTLRWAPRDFVFSRRKWMLDPQIDAACIPQPVPSRMPAKAYVYRTKAEADTRSMLAAKIMDSIRESGGDVCASEAYASSIAPSVAGHSKCCCIKIGKHLRHQCEHGFIW